MNLYTYFANKPQILETAGYLINKPLDKDGTIASLALITLGIAAFTWSYFRKPSTDFYKEFQKRINTENSYLYITDKSGCRKEKLLGVIGKGGSKKAVLLEEGRVLMVPNCDVARLELMIEVWNRIVNEEVETSNLFNNINLLSPLSQRVTVSLTSDAKNAFISAYVCTSFENIEKTQSIFIYDCKNNDSSTWKSSLFFNPEDRFQEEKWDEAVNALLVDISKIFIFDLPCGKDTSNIAFQENLHAIYGQSVPYKARFFGFDFSSKDEVLRIGKNFKMPEKWACRYIVNQFVKELISLEFKNWSPENDKFKTGETLDQFFDRLIEKYGLNVFRLCENSLAK